MQKEQEHHVLTDTYHHGGIVPLLISPGSIGIDAVIDYLERCQANSLHGAEVGLPEPVRLWTNKTDLKYTHKDQCERDKRATTKHAKRLHILLNI